MDSGVFQAICGVLAYVLEALADLFDQERWTEAAQVALPYVAWAAIGAAVLVVFDAALRFTLRAAEASLVLVLYLLGLPIILAQQALALCDFSGPATNPFDEEPLVPAHPSSYPLHHGSREQPALSAHDLVDRALSDLGVPAHASDEEICRAYLQLVREHHPHFSPHAPATARQASLRKLSELRQAYEIALGKAAL